MATSKKTKAPAKNKGSVPKPKKSTKKLARKSVATAPAEYSAKESVGVLAAEPLATVDEAERILLVGEEPLVSEYIALLSARDIRSAAAYDGSTSNIPFAFELTNLDIAAKRANLMRLDAFLPPSTVILSSSVTVSATEQASWIEHRERLLGIGALPSLSNRPLLEIAPTIHSPVSVVEHALTFLVRLEKQGEIVQDRVGLVFPRIICRLINEAAFALSEEIAVPQDLDAAIKLGLNHPRGPIEWVDRLGLAQVEALLRALERESGDPRYRIAPLLRQMALAGEWWRR